MALQHRVVFLPLSDISVYRGVQGVFFSNMGVRGSRPRKPTELFKICTSRGGGGGQDPSDPPTVHAPDMSYRGRGGIGEIRGTVVRIYCLWMPNETYGK